MLFALLAAGFGLVRVNAQPEPPVNLPIYVPSSTPTASADTGVIVYSTVTPVAATATPSSGIFVDDAETGTEIFLLAFLSLVAGVGLFFIKKYLDIKKYSI